MCRCFAANSNSILTTIRKSFSRSSPAIFMSTPSPECSYFDGLQTDVLGEQQLHRMSISVYSIIIVSINNSQQTHDRRGSPLVPPPLIPITKMMEQDFFMFFLRNSLCLVGGCHCIRSIPGSSSILWAIIINKKMYHTHDNYNLWRMSPVC